METGNSQNLITDS